MIDNCAWPSCDCTPKDCCDGMEGLCTDPTPEDRFVLVHSSPDDAAAELRGPCPECPDGQVWTSEGPTGRTCPRCKGHAIIWATEVDDE